MLLGLIPVIGCLVWVKPDNHIKERIDINRRPGGDGTKLRRSSQYLDEGIRV